MSEPMPARRETAFSRTEMDAVFEMAISSSDAKTKVTGEA